MAPSGPLFSLFVHDRTQAAVRRPCLAHTGHTWQSNEWGGFSSASTCLSRLNEITVIHLDQREEEIQMQLASSPLCCTFTSLLTGLSICGFFFISYFPSTYLMSFFPCFTGDMDIHIYMLKKKSPYRCVNQHGQLMFLVMNVIW